MKVVAINGSPRTGGNTEILLKKVLETLEAFGWETEYHRIGGKPVHGCRACMVCSKKKDEKCAMDNDFVNELLPSMYAADAILLGSPTYFADLTPELKALIDRAGFVALANGGKFSGKIGAAVVAVRRAGGSSIDKIASPSTRLMESILKAFEHMQLRCLSSSLKSCIVHQTLRHELQALIYL